MSISEKAIKIYRKQRFEDCSSVKKLSERRLWETLEEISPNLQFWQLPYKHQLASIILGIENKNFLFFNDMGTGKTAVALHCLAHLKLKKRLKSALVVSPNDVTINSWMKEIKKQTPELSVVPLIDPVTKKNISKEKKWERLKEGADLYLTNYVGLQVLVTEFSKTKRGKRKRIINEDLMYDLTDMFNTVVYDEIHRCKNEKSLTFQICDYISEEADYRYGMTGTPFGRKLMDIWSEFYLVDRGETFGDNSSIFQEAYFDMNVTYWGGVDYELKPKAAKQIGKRMRNKSIRYAEEECNTLPGKTFEEIEIPFSEEAWGYYRGLLDEMKAENSSTANGGQDRTQNYFAKMRQITSGFLRFKDDEGVEHIIKFKENPKMDEMVEKIQTTPESSKVIVFYSFIPSGDMMEERFKKEKIKYKRLHGKTKNKIQVVEEFITDESCKVLIANDEVAGTGSDDLKIANYAMYYESPCSPITRRQTEKRINRTGSTKHGFYYDFVTMNSVDERVLSFVKEGKNLSKEIFSTRDLLKLHNLRR